MKNLDIVFAGTPEFGIPCLNALLQSHHQLKAVYSQPDRPSGRGRKLQASAVKEWALTQGIPVYQPLHFKNEADREILAQLNPDVLVVIAYGLILPKAVLEIPKLGCINVHASLLPRWRGASPIQQAILHNDQKTGISIMQMDVGMDTGAVFSQVECQIDSSDTTASLHRKLAELAVNPLLNTLDALAAGSATAVAQQEELVSYAGKITKEASRIAWNQPVEAISCAIRAYYPWPIATTSLEGEVLRIHQAKPTKISCNEPPGSILTLDKQGMGIATADKMLLIEIIQSPGGKALPVAEWLNSRKTQLHKGLILG